MTTTEPQVTVIPAKNTETAQKSAYRPLRVAAYCRVSTAQEEQQNSYQVQIAYYTDLIHKNENWMLAGIFADATDIIGLKQNPTNGRRFSPIFSFIGHLSE